MRRNTEMTGTWVGLGLLLLGGSLLLLPLVASMDMMEAGFALQCLGVFVGLTGAVTAVLFGYRARRLQSMVRGEKLLAHWTYTGPEVEAQAARDMESARQRNRLLLLLVGGFVVACTVPMTIYGYLDGEGDNMPLFVGMMAAVFVLVAVFALGMPVLQARRARGSSHEALIAENGLYVNGALHTWNAPLALLDGVSMVEEEAPARLVFSLRSLSRASATAYQSYSVEVPVPAGEEGTARKIVAHFGKASREALA
ncbi:MAG TPA: hypothetical protein VLC95_13210 [Anaerolineae bacterium]|nr:hypothetical protein [Anaerolineae bacterium]